MESVKHSFNTNVWLWWLEVCWGCIRKFRIWGISKYGSLSIFFIDLVFVFSSLAYPNLLGTKGYVVVVVLNIHNMQISVRHIMVLNCFHYWWVMGPENAEEQDVELLQEWDISIHLLKWEIWTNCATVEGFCTIQHRRNTMSQFHLCPLSSIAFGLMTQRTLKMYRCTEWKYNKRNHVDYHWVSYALPNSG